MARNDLIQCHSDVHQYCYWRKRKVLSTILDADLCVVWVSAVCTVHVRIWTLTNAHGLFVLANCYTLLGGIYFSWRKRPYQLGVHNVSVWGKSLSLDLERRDISSVCEQLLSSMLTYFYTKAYDTFKIKKVFIWHDKMGFLFILLKKTYTLLLFAFVFFTDIIEKSITFSINCTHS